MIRISALAAGCVLVACSRGSATAPDVDSAVSDVPITVDAPLDSPGPYRHTIAIDGVDDFTAAEMFATTSNGYDARVTWDDANIYVGYSGPDLDPAAADSATKWLFAYVDVDPGAANGATTSRTYNTQTVTFPAGFRADFYVRWKCNGTFHSLEKHESGQTWMTQPTAPPTARIGNYLELAIPRAAIGTSGRVGIVTWMINEKAGFEGTYAGLYGGNFTDGYALSLTLTKYLEIDFTSTRDPSDPTNEAP